MADDLASGGAGLTVMAAAVALFFVFVAVIQHQLRVSLSIPSFGEPKRLVTDGIFALTRNPMYVAFLLPLLSIACYSPIAAIAAVALYILSMNSLVIAVEEETLASMFGSPFRRYCLATPRWLVW